MTLHDSNLHERFAQRLIMDNYGFGSNHKIFVFEKINSLLCTSTATYHTVNNNRLIFARRYRQPSDHLQLNSPFLCQLVVPSQPIEMLVAKDKDPLVRFQTTVELGHMTGIETLFITICLLISSHLSVCV